MRHTMHAAIIVAAAAATTQAQVPGDLVFVTDSGTVQWVPLAGGAGNLIATFSSDTTVDRLLDIEFGENHDVFLTSGPFPIADPSIARVDRISDPFGAAVVSNVASSDPIQNPNGIAWDPIRNTLFVMNNPGSQPNIGARAYEGVIEVTPNGSSVNGVFNEIPFPQPSDFPTFVAGGGVEIDAQNSDSLIVSAVEGGAFTFPSALPNQRGSAIFRLSPDGGGAFTDELIIDLSDTSATGLAKAYGRTTGIAPVGDSIFVSSYDFSISAGAILRIDLDVNGDAIGVTDITAGLSVPIFPEELEYNPISGTLVFSSRFAADQGIFEIGLDGSGFRNVFNGELTRGIAVFIPAPGATALLAGLGLVGLRRRR